MLGGLRLLGWTQGGGWPLLLQAGNMLGIVLGSVVSLSLLRRTKFSYDLWGDTVNIASRLESHGEPGRIQISAATRRALGDGFATTARGTIVLKGRGPVEAWWLDSEAAEATAPNRAHPVR